MASDLSGSPSEGQAEHIIRQALDLDSAGLHRAGVFLLAHAEMDRRLITLGLMSEINARGGLSLAAIQDLADEIAAETFGPHLARAASRLPVGMETIASDMNKARNAFLHWKRNRFLLPIYKGLDITTDAGFRTCMEDILLFLQTVPFVAPVGMGEPES